MSGHMLAVTVDITPQEPLAMFGYHHRKTPFQTVRTQLEANVLGLRGVDGRPLYLVSVDALYGGEIGSRLASTLSIDDDQVVVFGSHTHFAVGVDSGLSALGETNDEYLASVTNRIAEAIRIGEWRSAGSGSAAVGHVDGLFVNRRRPTFGIGLPIPKIGRSITAPNTKGTIDDTLRASAIWSGDDLVALVWGVSCHPVCSPDSNAISACFPGEVRKQLRGIFGDVPIIFAQGFSGDVRPASIGSRPRKSVKGVVQFALAGGRIFTPQSEAEYASWCSRLSQYAVDIVVRAKSSDREPLDCMAVKSTAQTPTGWERSPVLRHIRLTSELSFVTVNAEVVNDRIVEVETALGHSGAVIFPVGCCDEVIGYWPTDAMLVQGGYEAQGSSCFFPKREWSSVGGPDSLWQKLLSSLINAPDGEQAS